MEALARPRPTEAEPQFLMEWRRPGRASTGAWIGSILLHVAGLFLLVVVPGSVFMPPQSASGPRVVTALVAPPREMTQKEPNTGKIGKEVTLESLLPAPRMKLPPVPRGAFVPAHEAPAPAAIPEPPKVEAQGPSLAQSSPPGSPAGVPQPPPPQIQPVEKPRIAFETPGTPEPRKPTGLAPPRIQAPDTGVSEAMRGAIRGGGGSVRVGDADLEGGAGSLGIDLPAAPGKTASALELLSDPMGVDFKPYLIRVLAAVKRNWLAIIPESARLGRAGRVQIQFAIARDGNVPKLVIAMPSGTDALDRAAVAGVSASQPFPPFPTGFQGAQVRLQFTFLYNVH